MALFLTREAMRDLSEIDAFLADRSPPGLSRVIASIKSSLTAMETMPRIGRETAVSGVRVYVETRYGYIIPYLLKGDDVWVLRVYDSRRPPLDIDSLGAPE